MSFGPFSLPCAQSGRKTSATTIAPNYLNQSLSSLIVHQYCYILVAILPLVFRLGGVILVCVKIVIARVIS